jgi:hypothetical protein
VAPSGGTTPRDDLRASERRIGCQRDNAAADPVAPPFTAVVGRRSASWGGAGQAGRRATAWSLSGVLRAKGWVRGAIVGFGGAFMRGHPHLGVSLGRQATAYVTHAAFVGGLRLKSRRAEGADLVGCHVRSMTRDGRRSMHEIQDCSPRGFPPRCAARAAAANRWLKPPVARIAGSSNRLSFDLGDAIRGGFYAANGTPVWFLHGAELCCDHE